MHRNAASRQPALLFLASLLVRVGVTLAGFYLIADGHGQRLLLCLGGFVVARLAVTRLTCAAEGKSKPSAPEIEHAP